MCTPSTGEMYRVVKLDDPDTYPGTFGSCADLGEDAIHVLKKDVQIQAGAEAEKT